MSLHRYLAESPFGYCRNFGMPREVVTLAARHFVTTLMDAYAKSKGKRRWAEKTPDNLMYLDFLAEMFPHAAFIHLVRDGLDNAISTSVIAPHRKGISDWHEKFLSLGPECAVENNLFNATLRWNHWNRRVDELMSGRRLLQVGYEKLVYEPRSVLQSIFEFIEEPFDPSALDYARFQHDLPDCEWGSADVKHFTGITKERVGRSNELDSVERELLLPITLYGRQDGTSSVSSQVGIAPTLDIEDRRGRLLMEYVNSFARSTGLAPLEELRAWAYSWLWLHALHNIDWRNKKLVFMDTEASPIPWILALLGAEVTLLDSFPERIPVYASLREKTKVRIHWRQANLPQIPVADEYADILISTSLGQKSDDNRTVVAEMGRVLKKKGILALTFDFAKAEFEELFWFNAAFGNLKPPDWRGEDIHLSGRLAAAVLRKA